MTARRRPCTSAASRRRRKQRAEAVQEWECRAHRVPAGDRCDLCSDQIDLFELSSINNTIAEGK